MVSEITESEARYLHSTDFRLFIRRSFEILNPNSRLLDNWTIDCLSAHLEAVRKGELKRLIINIPPRFLKSTITNIAFPAWLLGHNPAEKIISTSYAESLARTQSMQTRDLIKSDYFQWLFPTRLKDDQDTQRKFTTTKYGHRIATSVGGSITGQGADILILDDPNDVNLANSKPHLDQVIYYYRNVLYSRLNNKREGKVIVIQQRCHANDLTGYLLESDKSFYQLKLPIIFEKPITIQINGFKKDIKEGELLHEARENKDVIEATKNAMGTMAFTGQYLQEPASVEGNLFKESWLGWHDRNSFDMIYQAWDTAVKTKEINDYSVCTTWGVENNQFYLLDLFRDRLEFPQLKRAMLVQAEKWQPKKILIEDKASGQGLLQTLRQETKLPLVAYMPDKDKVTRFSKAMVHFEAGRIHFPKKHFTDTIIAEMKLFPNTAHDDICDSVSSIINWHFAKPKAEVIVL